MGRKYLFLIADDIAENRLFLRKLLESKGYEVLEAENGREALKIAELKTPDFIISDILMPVMDGFQLCIKIKKNDKLKNIPFIFYTATYTSKKDEEFALGLGAARFIIKPVEPDTFLNIFDQILEDYETGALITHKIPLEEEDTFKLYSERLVNKLEQKMLSMEKEIADRKLLEVELKKQLQEKEIILKEAHHRIKNNFTSIGSLLQLQSASLSNPEAISAVQDAYGRVNSISKLYENMLLEGSYTTSSVKEYISNLIDDIANLLMNQDNIVIEKQISDFILNSKDLVSLGIILNELLTNILKYAFEGKDSGLIKIILEKKNWDITLTIQDNGIGLPEEFDLNKQKGFGLVLIKMLSEQLDGKFTIENDNGTISTLGFST